MRALTVLEVTSYVKELVEFDPVLSDIWIRGEVSNFSRSAAGHMYFCLTGDGTQLNCVLFRRSQAGILAVPRNGDEVLAHGRLTIYESRGQYQLMVDNVAPEGIGILQLQLEETKRRLEAEGLFAAERKRPIPSIPSVIGVVTSAHGSVWHDIQNVVRRRFPLAELVLAPSAVQGPNAADELISALMDLQERVECDVIIIARGGGSEEDLACFSDERLARAIFSCRVPVVSAIGHETDWCIADLVADVRAPTPSAAAELCVPNGAALLGAAGLLVQQGRAHAMHALRTSSESLSDEHRRIQRHHPSSIIDRGRQRIDEATQSASREILRSVADSRALLASLSERASLLNPGDVLRRGYAVVTAGDANQGERVASAESAKRHDRLTVTFADGAIQSQVVRE
jgi:exodeoxyribonuclease VII large subunit